MAADNQLTMDINHVAVDFEALVQVLDDAISSGTFESDGR